MSFQITIDGPAGAGKTTMAKAIATKYQIQNIDTGAFYRAFAIGAFDSGLSPYANEKEITDFINSKTSNSIKVNALTIESKQTMIVNENIQCFEDSLRDERVGQYASILSAYPNVRENINKSIKEYAKSESCIMEGRDTGTIILPNADIKFYLTASSYERATRRIMDLYMSGVTNNDIKTIQKEIEERDKRDKTRDIAPLIQAEDAIYIDNTNLKSYDCFKTMCNNINSKLNIKEI